MVKKPLAVISRVLLRHRRFTAINMLGLAVGLASCLALTGYILREKSSGNGFVPNDRILWANGLPQAGGGPTDQATAVPPLGPAAVETIPEVEAAGRIAGKYDVMLTVGNATFTEKKMYFVEPQAFAAFNLPLVCGSPRKALEAPFSLVIDEVLARRYFGANDPLGRTIRVTFDRPYEFRVTGVVKGLPTNTGLFVRMLASFSTLEALPGNELRFELKGWQAFELYYTLLQLRAAIETPAAEARISG